MVVNCKSKLRASVQLVTKMLQPYWMLLLFAMFALYGIENYNKPAISAYLKITDVYIFFQFVL
jgi:hypothetical protein